MDTPIKITLNRTEDIQTTGSTPFIFSVFFCLYFLLLFPNHSYSLCSCFFPFFFVLRLFPSIFVLLLLFLDLSYFRTLFFPLLLLFRGSLFFDFCSFHSASLLCFSVMKYLSFKFNFVGQRERFLIKYKVGCNSDGKINAIDYRIFADAGNKTSLLSSLSFSPLFLTSFLFRSFFSLLSFAPLPSW